jgi:hypothetical protein
MESDPDYRDRVIEQRKRAARTPERNREYMRAYYQRNKDRFKRTPEQQELHNEQRRKRYAEDADYRRRVLAEVKGVDPATKRDWRLRRQYGIGAVEFDAILERQDGHCAICPAEVGSKGGRRLSVDHCHRTGRVRGILCSECNLGLGKFRDDPDLIEKAAQYLRQAEHERN